ncbi:membrane protein [Psychromicrobium lacuslunae]|uniref:FAD:protein FMN transferase n=1 Tax=Psychromicrobium lacuslunae TaxID=1618207 RepID=A0A0D4C3K4_9MICC|nr:membrane protein [Psychromicrobium lacuslunae]
MAAQAQYRFEAIGTHWQIDTAEELSPTVRQELGALIERYDQAFSRFRGDSLVSQAAREPGRYQLPPPAEQLAEFYRKLYELTDGAMTPLVGDSLSHLGYDASYSLRAGDGFLPPPSWQAAIEWQGTQLHTKLPVALDLGAAGKGQLVDLLAELLTEHGVMNFVIDASGDMFTSLSSPLSIALEHPYDASSAIGVVQLGGRNTNYRAICASASNRRNWGDGLHHVLDGGTGQPVQTVVASWVLAADAMHADGLATALFFTDHSVLQQDFDFASVRLFSDGRAEVSANFDGELFFRSDQQ